ncbi:MAG: peptide chain release factor N(5)-glutamine methyltransferase [Clostridia bacterium]|nr:peptide chain release factor N(5)-glutamine methyltransferase [Clostridia bacterium]
MTVRQLLKSAADRLQGVGITDPLVDASLLLSHVTGIAPLMLRADAWREVSDKELSSFEALLLRRLSREPLQYILGSVEFMGLQLRTSPDALIPRYDTEILCEEALRRVQKGFKVLDLCTGTGVIALTMKKHAPSCEVWAVDISENALALAGKNAKSNALDVTFRQGDLFAPLQGESFDMIVSNPPYISDADMLSLSPEVLSEPRLALEGGKDGLDFYRRIVSEAPAYLRRGGYMLFEIGCDQAQAVSRMMARDFEDVTVCKDLAGLDRVVLGRVK